MRGKVKKIKKSMDKWGESFLKRNNKKIFGLERAGDIWYIYISFANQFDRKVINWKTIRSIS